jgi:hypothetical protein
MWLAQFVCAPQFFKYPKGLCRHTLLFIKYSTIWLCIFWAIDSVVK